MLYRANNMCCTRGYTQSLGWATATPAEPFWPGQPLTRGLKPAGGRNAVPLPGAHRKPPASLRSHQHPSNHGDRGEASGQDGVGSPSQEVLPPFPATSLQRDASRFADGGTGIPALLHQDLPIWTWLTHSCPPAPRRGTVPAGLRSSSEYLSRPASSSTSSGLLFLQPPQRQPEWPRWEAAGISTQDNVGQAVSAVPRKETCKNQAVLPM